MWRRRCGFASFSSCLVRFGAGRQHPRQLHTLSATQTRVADARASDDVPREDASSPLHSPPPSSTSNGRAEVHQEPTMTQAQLHVMLRMLAQAATTRSTPRAVTSVMEEVEDKGERTGISLRGARQSEVRKGQERLNRDKESIEKDGRARSAVRTPGTGEPTDTRLRGPSTRDEKELLKRLLLAKRGTRSTTAPRPPHTRVTARRHTTAIDGERHELPDAPLHASGATAVKSLSSSVDTSPWQTALALFFAAIHDHAVTPTAQHFNLLLQLATHDEAWAAVEDVEEYYARFLASVSELREAKAQAMDHARRTALTAHEREEEAEEAAAGEDSEADNEDVQHSSLLQGARPHVAGLALAPATRPGAEPPQLAIADLRRQLGDLESAEDALRPNAQIFHVLMRGALARRRWPLVLEYFENMRDYGLVLADETLQYVLEATYVSVCTSSSLPPMPHERHASADRHLRRQNEDEPIHRATGEGLRAPVPHENEEELGMSFATSPLHTILQAAQRAHTGSKGERQRLTTSLRGPQLRAAAQPAPSPLERAQVMKAQQREHDAAQVCRASAQAAYELVRDYCHLITQPRTVWLVVSILQHVHTPESPRRMIEVYQLFPHLMQPSGMSLWSAGVSDQSFMPEPAREGPGHSPGALTGSHALSPSLASTSTHRPHISWSPPSSMSTSSPLFVGTEAMYTVWTWLAVSAAACDVGDWVVAKEIWHSAVLAWWSDTSAASRLSFTSGPARPVAPVSVYAPTLTAEERSEQGKGLLYAASQAHLRHTFLTDVVQPLLVNTLHALRRVRRYADILALYQRDYVPALHAVATQASVRAVPALWTTSDAAAARLFCSPAALVLVAQAATALQRIDVLLTLIDAEAAVVGARGTHDRGHSMVPAVVPLPADVYESALRTHHMQQVLAKQQQENEERDESKASKSSSTASAAEAKNRAEYIYEAYLAAARDQLRARGDASALGTRHPHGNTLLTREHEPLLRVLFALKGTSSTTAAAEVEADVTVHKKAVGEVDDSRQIRHKALWRQAFADWERIRRPDALHVALMADILLAAVRHTKDASEPGSERAQLAEAIGRLLRHLLRDLPDALIVNRSAVSPSPVPVPVSSMWERDAAAVARARLDGRLARVHVGEVAMTRTLHALTLVGQPFEVLACLPRITTLAWLSEDAATQQRRYAEREAVEKTRADYLRAQQAEQQVAETMTHTQTSSDMPQNSTVAAGASAAVKNRENNVNQARYASAPSHSLKAGEATQLLMALVSQSAPDDGNPGGVAHPLKSVLHAAARLIQQLQHVSGTPADAFDALLAALHALPAHSSMSMDAAAPPPVCRNVAVVLPAVVDAVLEQVSVSTTARCTLWSPCLALLDSTLLSPFDVHGTAPLEENKVMVSVATLPLLSRFIRYCDRAEADFVAHVVLTWLRPDRALPCPQRTASSRARTTPAPSACAQGWELALDALIWACRRREKALAKRIYSSLRSPLSGAARAVTPSVLPLSETPVSSAPAFWQESRTHRQVFAQLVLLQCLTSGKHEDVLHDWVIIHGLFVELIEVTVRGVQQYLTSPPPSGRREQSQEPLQRSKCERHAVFASRSEVVTLADALVAVCVKVQKTLHHLLVGVALDAHRRRCESSQASQRRESKSGKERLAVEVEAMARDYHTLLGPLSSDDSSDKSVPPSPLNDSAVQDAAVNRVPVRAPQLLSDVLLPLCAHSSSSHGAVPFPTAHRILMRAINATWDVLYAEYVWLACFEHGERVLPSPPPRHRTATEAHDGVSQQVHAVSAQRAMVLYQCMTQLLQLEVELCPTAPSSAHPHRHPHGRKSSGESSSKNAEESEEAWSVLRERLTRWSVVTAHMSTWTCRPLTASSMASAVARMCNHLTTMEAFLGARVQERTETASPPSSMALASFRHARERSRGDRMRLGPQEERRIQSIPVLFLEIVRDLTEAVLVQDSATQPASASAASPSLSHAFSLPPLPDGSVALTRFQSPVSLLSADRAALSLLHDTALHLLYVALCEESIPRAVLLHPALTSASHAPRAHDDWAHRKTHAKADQGGIRFSEAGLLASALTWCGGWSVSRYTDVLRASAPFFPNLVRARCCFVRAASRDASIKDQKANREEVTEAHGMAGLGTVSKEVEVMRVVFDRLTALCEWQLRPWWLHDDRLPAAAGVAHTLMMAAQPTGSRPQTLHVEALLSVLQSTPQDLYGSDVHIEGPTLSESVAASALKALSLTLLSSAGLATTAVATSRTASSLAGRSPEPVQGALQQAERVIRAFPTVIMRESVVAWASGGFTALQTSAMDALCTLLWWRSARRDASAAVQRAALSWSVAVHGTWPHARPERSDSPLCLARACTNDVDSTVSPATREALTLDVLGGLKEALLVSLAARQSSSDVDRRRPRPRADTIFTWSHWAQGTAWCASASSERHTRAPVPTGVTADSANNSNAARAVRCLNGSVAVQLLDVLFPRATAPGESMTAAAADRCAHAPTVSEDVLAQLLQSAGRRLSAERKASIERMNEELRETAMARAADPKPNGAPPDQYQVDSTDGSASPMVVLVRALVRAVVVASSSSSPSAGVFDPAGLLRDVRSRVLQRREGAAVAAALVDWGAVYHALAAAATSYRCTSPEAVAGLEDIGRLILTREELDAIEQTFNAVEQAFFEAASSLYTHESTQDVSLQPSKAEVNLTWLSQSLVLAVTLAGGPLTSISPQWLLATYTRLYRPSLPQASVAVRQIWSHFVVHHVDPLFSTHMALCQIVSAHAEGPSGVTQAEGSSIRVEAMKPEYAWAPLLHVLALDLTGLELAVSRVPRQPDDTVRGARPVLVDMQRRWTPTLALPEVLLAAASRSSPAEPAAGTARDAVRCWAVLSILLGTWREPLHLFNVLAAAARTHKTTVAMREYSAHRTAPISVVGALATLVVCAAMPHGPLTPAVVRDLVTGLHKLEEPTANRDAARPLGAGQGEPQQGFVGASVEVVLALHAAGLADRAALRALTHAPVAVRVVVAAPLRHVLTVTETHPSLRAVFFRTFISDAPREDNRTDAWPPVIATAWASLLHGQHTAGHETSLSASSSGLSRADAVVCSGGSLSGAWAKVQSALRVLGSASEEALRTFVANESRRQRRHRRPRESVSIAGDAHTAAAAEVDALRVKKAWADLVEGLAESAISTVSDPVAPRARAKEHDQKETDEAALRADVLRVLTSPDLSVVPHTIHFFPLSLSEALVWVVCGTWQDAMRLLRFSLSTLRKTGGTPTPVQQHLAALMLQRVRQDGAFAAQVNACECSMPVTLLRLAAHTTTPLAEAHTLRGGAALAATCLDLVAIPPWLTPSSSSAHSTKSAPVMAVVPQRMLMEALRHAATDMCLAQTLYRIAWQQPYTRLEGPSVFLSLLRAARLSQRGDVGLQVMADFLAIVCAPPRQPQAHAVLPAPCDVVRAWQTRVSITRFSPEAHRVVWRAFARLCEAHLITAEAAYEVLVRFRTTAPLSDVEELLVTVHFEQLLRQKT